MLHNDLSWSTRIASSCKCMSEGCGFVEASANPFEAMNALILTASDLLDPSRNSCGLCAKKSSVHTNDASPAPKSLKVFKSTLQICAHQFNQIQSTATCTSRSDTPAGGGANRHGFKAVNVLWNCKNMVAPRRIAVCCTVPLRKCCNWIRFLLPDYTWTYSLARNNIHPHNLWILYISLLYKKNTAACVSEAEYETFRFVGIISRATEGPHILESNTQSLTSQLWRPVSLSCQSWERLPSAIYLLGMQPTASQSTWTMKHQMWAAAMLAVSKYICAKQCTVSTFSECHCSFMYL